MGIDHTSPEKHPFTLRAHFGRRASTEALFTGAVRSPLLKLDICGPTSAIEGFRPFVREARFDIGEIALATYLVARSFGKPLVLLPAVVLGRFQHGFMFQRTELGAISPRALEGRRVAVRSYTVTTGLWLRAVLQHDHGVDLSRITWVTYEEPHVEEFRDPPNVERIDLNGRTPEDLLFEGVVDAAILGTIPKPDPRIRQLLDDPDAAALAWHNAHRAVPANHFVAVSTTLSKDRPDVVREAYRMLSQSKALAGPPNGAVDTLPFGMVANRGNLELAIRYAHEQGIIPSPVAVDDLFDDVTRTLEG